jgi:hypothetical protein
LRSEVLGWLARRAHRVHRFVGSVLAVLLLVWFASGAVMTFTEYPRYSERERLAHASPLTLTGNEDLPLELHDLFEHGGGAQGDTLILAQVEGEPRWLFTKLDGTRAALSVRPPWQVPPLSAARARREAERIGRAYSTSVTRVEEPDQWTVGHSAKGAYPLWHVKLDEEARTEIYLCERTGEVVQQTTRSERLLAWLGPIPHWIYPAMLRRHRDVWRTSVLWLAGFGLVVTLSGLISGAHVYRVSRRSAASKAPHIRDRTLRWHQRLGLGFGMLASTWLFSGALSLTPFHWTGDGSAELRVVEHLHRAGDAAVLPGASWQRCSTEMDVRELHVAMFGGTAFIVCLAEDGTSRVVRQDDPALTPRSRLELADIMAATAPLGSAPTLALLSEPDAYYYPSHSLPDVALPFVRADMHDDDGTTLYLDPARGRLLAHYNELTRLERWLYHGLHSLDFAPLYEHRALWRTLLILAMATGTFLASLGLFMALRRANRRRRLAARALNRD